MRNTLPFVLVALLCVSGASLRAEDAKPAETKKVKKGEERLYPRGPEVEKLKTELGLTDDQIARIKTAIADVNKKHEELSARAEVKAAEEAVEKAKAALKAAEEKEKAASDNFDLNEEHKKAIYANIPDDKKEKAQEVIHYHPKVEKKAKKDAKAEVEKK
ncbi:MAG TPA: hypothetical protein VGP72_17940 [Planctomycetota bacterium]|jgi:hypothetical protein